MDTQTFFDDALPALIARRPTFFDAANGTISVTVQGAGAWTLTFGDHRATDAVKPGLDLDADLLVAWSEAQFQTLLDGEGSADNLEPVAIGDVKLLGRLGGLLQPPAKGGLGARLAAF
jgi:hypothetical protein